MTTVLADYKLGVMVADSSVTDGDRQWSLTKVTRIRGAIIGHAGHEPDQSTFFAWYRSGFEGQIKLAPESNFLILSEKGLYLFNSTYSEPQRLPSGRDAIGSGSKAAMCAYEALGWADPKKAVQIVCKHDAGSRTPVRMYNLKVKPR